MTRKPGEPIYLKRHMLGLALALIAPILLPLLYHNYVGPLSFASRFAAGLAHRSDRKHRALFRLPNLGTEPAIASLSHTFPSSFLPLLHGISRISMMLGNASRSLHPPLGRGGLR